MKTWTLIATFVSLVTHCTWTIPVGGQDVDVPLQLAVPQPLGVIDFGIQARKQQEAAARRLREGAENYLAIRIDEMKRVCQLSETQIKTLQVAAKGAIQQHLEKWQQRNQPVQVQIAENPFVAQFGNVGDAVVDVVVDADVGDAPAEAAEVDEQVNEEVGEKVGEDPPDEDKPEPEVHPPGAAAVIFQPAGAALQARRIALPGPRVWRALNVNESDASAVAKEPVWEKTIDRVLTDEQKQAMHQCEADRAAFRRQSAVSNLVARIDETLLLSAQQRQGLADLIIESIGDRFDDQLLNQGLVVSQVAQLIPKDKLRGLLSDAQLANWDGLQAGMIDRGGQWGAFANGGFFGVWDVIPPAAKP